MQITTTIRYGAKVDSELSKVAVGVVTALTKDTVKSIFSYFPAKIKGKYDVYFKNFENYLDRTHKTCAFVRTIINKERPVNIKDIYVKGSFQCAAEVIDDDELCEKIREGLRVVVAGFGGIGKTIFCKYFWKTLYDNPIGKIPIYFELRNLNDISSQSLEAYLRVSISLEGEPIPENVFREMMNAGRFVFILDGFDEIPEKNRLNIQSQILKMANVFGDCAFVVSSRADDRFFSWQEFHTYTAKSFNKDQSKEVVKRVEFDAEIKKEFLTEILEKKYEDYKFFFATPLLTLMMLMTYNQIRYVPDSRHIFYKYAFQTLYTLHDASKQGFQRARFVEMSESEFINVFSLFSLVSYADSEHSFSHDEMLNYLEKIKVRAIAKFDSEKFIQECTESVNLIYKEGSQYTFIHRSFQEYFCAYAATHYFPDALGDVVLSLPANRTDSVFGMMYQMSPEIVSRMFIRPVYERFKAKINEATKIVGTFDFLKALSVHVEILFDANVKSGRFGYGWHFADDVKKFSDALTCMFKDELPSPRVAEHAGFHNLNSLIKHMRELIQIKPPRNSDLAYFARIDFDEEFLAINIENPEREQFGDIVYSAKFSEFEEIISMRYFEEVARALKAELVFTKKKSDEVTRKIRDVSKKSEGILSL